MTGHSDCVGFAADAGAGGDVGVDFVAFVSFSAFCSASPCWVGCSQAYCSSDCY